jgi:hypothetical protein
MVASRVRARVIVRNANLGITEKSDRDTLKMDSAEATVNHVVPVCRFVLQTERTLENNTGTYLDTCPVCPHGYR